ncbi:uncharacterized protein FA14DRAFT_156244 [Meira miltonrushii]|uniref:Uncharacterized protein n=1 Tax=Meira miltonrushii TaxID=1280837 RepID=A0A316VBE6_9BASI|nr:uncharacterized protein FA14DRAFT_156244 [Meira miltonrushii]PWN33553.1 hypothetical protein FA14DRAFT_156244 [Meira miltonrushii]
MKGFICFYALILVSLTIVMAGFDGTPSKVPFRWNLNQTPSPEEGSHDLLPSSTQERQEDMSQHPQVHLPVNSNGAVVDCPIHSPTCIHWKTLSDAEKRKSQRQRFEQQFPEKAAEKRAKKRKAYSEMPKDKKERFVQQICEYKKRKLRNATESEKSQIRREKADKARIYERNRRIDPISQLTMTAADLELYRQKRRLSGAKARKEKLDKKMKENPSSGQK